MLACLIFLLCGAVTPTVQAGEPVRLALRFREGQILRYTYLETVAYTPPTKFVGVPGWNLDVKVDFSIKVNSVNDDAAATVRLVFERLTVLKDGTQIADLTVFPRQADGVSAIIKPNGETTFYKNFYLAINRGGQLEFRVSNGGGVMATNTTAAVGSENFVLAADLDHGAGIIRIGVPPTRTLETPDHAKLCEFKIDLTPRKLFEILTMPTVPLAEGETFSIPVKYLGQEKLVYQGQADEVGFQGSQVQVELTPWTEPADGLGGLQPLVNGNISYLIDTTGKLAKARGRLHTEIMVPGIGPQIAETRLEITLRK